MSEELKKCPRCGTTNPGAHTFCYRCGESLPEPRPPACPSCGAEIPSAEFAYCPRCGVALGQAGSPPSPTAGLGPSSQPHPEGYAVGSPGLASTSRRASYGAEPAPAGIEYGGPPRRSRTRVFLVIVVASAIVALLVVLALVPLRTVTNPGSNSGFNEPGLVTTYDGYTLYLANLTFTASKGVAVQVMWATNQSENLCGVAVGGPAAGAGAWFNEGSDVCSGNHNFTSQGGTFYFVIDATGPFSVSGSVTLGSTTSKAPIL